MEEQKSYRFPMFIVILILELLEVICMKKELTAVLLGVCLLLNACASIGTEAQQPQMTIGDISQQKLLTKYSAFEQEYTRFQLQKSDQALVNSWPESISVTAFFGTWCHDSEREVPRLLKALNNKVNVNLIGLDYTKSEHLGRAVKAGISFTPTFIIYNNGTEIGRIVERPKVSLVEDISAFIKKEAI